MLDLILRDLMGEMVAGSALVMDVIGLLGGGFILIVTGWRGSGGMRMLQVGLLLLMIQSMGSLLVTFGMLPDFFYSYGKTFFGRLSILTAISYMLVSLGAFLTGLKLRHLRDKRH